ncbi:MAG: hypothetical protein ACR2NP_12310, partial [Pirellulaceae bacterium]
MLLRLTLSVALCLALILAPQASAQDSVDVPEYTIEQFLKTINHRGSSFSPDNTKLLISSDVSGVFNAYAIPVEGGEPEQLTESTTDTISAISYFPTDERFLYTADQGGNELNHIYVRNLDGTSQDLTPGENLKAQFAGWAQDDKSFYVTTNERDQKYFDLYQFDVETLERELVVQNDEGYSIGDISPDGNTIALGKTTTRNDSDVYLFDRTTGEITHITPHEGDIAHAPATFSPDGKHLLMVTDADSDFRYLVKHDLATGDRETVVQKDWDIAFAGFSKHGKYFFYGVNEDARTVIKAFVADTMEEVELPVPDGGTIGSFGMSDDESHLAMYVASDKSPSDLYYLNLSAEESAEPVKLTRSLNPEIEPDHLVSGEVVRFKSFDGIEIPGILYKPHQASSDDQAPALVWVHGGPGGQSRVGYSGLIQFLVNHGYVVYAINNRGSSGYGKAFEAL